MNDSTLSRTLLSDVAALEALTPEWEALLARSRHSEPTLSPTWMLSWWRVFGGEGNRALRALAVREGGKLVGLAPLLLRPASYPPGIPFRRLELLASGEDESDETCSDYIGILAAAEHEAAVADALAEAVIECELGSWDELVLPAMNAEGAIPSLLADAFRRHGIAVELSDPAPSPYVALPKTWDEYLERLPSRRRYMVRKSLRDFEAWAGAPPSLVRARTSEELARAQDALYALHRERWSREGKVGVFDSPRFRAFHELVMPELMAKDALWVGTIEAHGEPIAAFYNLVWGGKARFYQSGRKVDLPRQLRPGIVMHACLIRAAIEAGLTEYDFLGGTSRYKTELATAQRPLVTLRAAPASLVETARRTTERAIGQARRIRTNLFERPKKEHAA